MEHMLPGSPVVFILAWFGWRIASKAGYSGFWGLTAIIPPIGLVALWILASKRDWPRDSQQATSFGSASRASATGTTTPATRDTGGITIRRPGGPVTKTD
ncbi:MAG: hypothetical protein P1U65_19360 [Minwuia sp.]|nr:hypothetical protein [Minwuia sp.]